MEASHFRQVNTIPACLAPSVSRDVHQDGALGHLNAWIHRQAVLVEPLKNIKGPPPIGEGPLLVLNGSGERI